MVSCPVLQDSESGPGLQALNRAALTWAPLFAHSPITEVLPCISALITPPLGGSAVAQLFGPHFLAAVGRAILSQDQSLVDLGMPLLVDLCNALRPQGSSVQHASLPVILTAHQHGLQMASFIQNIIGAWPQPPPATDSSIVTTATEAVATAAHGSSIALAWAAVQCLPHADSNPQRSVKLLQRLTSATEPETTNISRASDAAVTQASDAAVTQASDAATNSAKVKRVLFLHCYTRGTLASLLKAHAPQDLAKEATSVLKLLQRHPHDFHVIRCAAEVVSLAKEVGSLFPASQLQVLFFIIMFMWAVLCLRLACACCVWEACELKSFSPAVLNIVKRSASRLHAAECSLIEDLVFKCMSVHVHRHAIPAMLI